MSDLIHQLRQGAYHCDDYRWRAADEITALAETISQQDQHIENLTNINEKLRAALREIAEGCVSDHPPTLWAFARAALEGKQ